MSRHSARTRDLWNRVEPELRYRVLPPHVHVQGLPRNSLVGVEEEPVALIPEDGGHTGILELAGTNVKWPGDQETEELSGRKRPAVSCQPPADSRHLQPADWPLETRRMAADGSRKSLVLPPGLPLTRLNGRRRCFPPFQS